MKVFFFLVVVYVCYKKGSSFLDEMELEAFYKCAFWPPFSNVSPSEYAIGGRIEGEESETELLLSSN